MYSIVAENEHFIVVNKHVGVCVHSEPDEVGLLVQMKQDLQLEQLLPVHRLDKVTSGLLLCAKTKLAASELSQLFQRREVEKYYLAISDQKPKKKQGLVSGDMEASRRGAWKLCHTKDNPAVTQFFSYGLGQGQRLFVLKPNTGKTHQLRVALKSLGSPIMGDRLYGHPLTISLPVLSGVFLHAFVLRFTFQGENFQYVDMPSHWDAATEFSNDSIEKFANELLINRPWEMPWPVLASPPVKPVH
jgi:tRNA pseudouridine32 synthase/23S rRNA pseudouridine746 synthase